MGDSHLEWLNQFAKGLELLDDYDHEKLDAKGLSKQQAVYPDIHEYQEVVDAMKKDFESGVFGKEKDGSFQSAVSQIAKGFGEEDFYPSLEEKAATLLYLIVKNHGFVDGSITVRIQTHGLTHDVGRFGSAAGEQAHFVHSI